MHYYNVIPSPYRHRIEEKAINNLGSSLHTFLEYEEQLERIGLPKGYSVKQKYMSSLLQLVKDMKNQMIAYERKVNVPSLTPGESSSSSTPFRNKNENKFQPKSIMSCSWCNFCEENHEESTSEVKKNSRDNIFGKNPETTIVVLDWVELEDFMIINTRNKPYTPKEKYNPLHAYSTPTSSSQGTNVQTVKIPKSQGVPSLLLSSKYNILNQLDNIKANATLFDMVVIPEQQKHLRNFMEGKSSTIANIS
jgi:hypothetical protein